MSQEEVSSIIREIDLFRKENKEDHAEIKRHAEHTNGTVAELVKWKIQVKTVLWIFGLIITSVVIPVGVSLIISLIEKNL